VSDNLSNIIVPKWDERCLGAVVIRRTSIAVRRASFPSYWCSPICETYWHGLQLGVTTLRIVYQCIYRSVFNSSQSITCSPKMGIKTKVAGTNDVWIIVSMP
jgi:hypothetical protein